MSRSYSVRYWNAEGGTMLGAVRRSETCRYETRELALLRFMGVVDAHIGTSAEGKIRGELVSSNRRPEITLDDSGSHVRELVQSDRFVELWREYESLCAAPSLA